MGAGADLLGLCWTVSGPVEVHLGREWSLFDPRDRWAYETGSAQLAAARERSLRA